MPKIPYRDNVTVNSPICEGIRAATANIEVTAEIKLWNQKGFHKEGDNPGKGDDISFMLAFGNDGELPCPADPTMPTLEDTLVIAEPISLKLMSLCLCSEYELWVVNVETPYKVNPCKVFEFGTYTLQLRKWVDGILTPYFDVPCHYICCICMLFQIEFPACPPCLPCQDECQRSITNPSFEDGLEGWNTHPGGQVSDEDEFNCGGTTFDPVEGDEFALLQTHGQNQDTILTQTISVCEGDKLNGWSFFCTDIEEQLRVPDVGIIEILDSNNQVVHTAFNRNSNQGSNNAWVAWSEYTFTAEGSYIIQAKLTSGMRAANNNSYLGVDDITLG